MTHNSASPNPQLENSDAPATKADLLELWKAIEARFERTATQESLDNLADHLGEFRDQVEQAMDEKIDGLEARIDVKLDALRSDVIGATRDAISNLDVRVTKLEERVGLQ